MDLLNEEFLLFLKCAQQNKLKYMLIGGYAVNYHGYNRNTADMDVWIAPTNENKLLFINTLLCMKYSENEVSMLYDEDFTVPFLGNFGTVGNDIDVLTVVHHSLSFDKAYLEKEVFQITDDISMNIVPYSFLRDMKLFARRPKDILDLTELEKIKKKI
jgi:hypothetical protein